METELKNQRIPVMMSASEVRNLDAWRRAQEDLPSRGEAIRRLIEAGLKAKTSPVPKAAARKKPSSPP
jgi:hypothetical protein